jgi:hypothetical protein
VLFLYILCATFYPSSGDGGRSSPESSVFADAENGSTRKLNMQFKLNNGGVVEKSAPPETHRIFVNESGLQLPLNAMPGPSNSSRRLRGEEETQKQAPMSAVESPRVQFLDRQVDSPRTATSQTQSSLAVIVPEDNISPASTSRFYPPSAAESSPVYGLNGIVRGSSAVPSSINSRMSDLSSLFRRQAELNKSIGGLLLFSKRDSKSPADSDFSLSIFPEPPSVKTSFGPKEMGAAKGELILDNTTFSLVPPTMPAAGGHGRQPSVPQSMQGSEDGVLLGAGRDRFPSNATRYDVTSFIGGTSCF